MTTSRILRARYPGTCSVCGAALATGDRAWWDADARTIWCLGYHESAPVAMGDGDGVPPPIDAGEAGRSAQAEFDRRHARRGQRLEERWGRFAGIAKFVSADPESTAAWQKGAEGERRVAAHLERAVGGRAVFLHDRRIPRSRANIDLLVVAPSGVWIVDSKHWSGKVARRDVGGAWRTGRRLFVGGRDCTAAVEGMEKQVAAVTEVLGDPHVPVIPALCFVNAEWGVFAKAFRVQGVSVTWAKRFAELILDDGPLDPVTIERTAATLASGLPAR